MARFALRHLSTLAVLFVPFRWALVGWLAGGLTAFVWGYLLSTVLLSHATFAINSVAHICDLRPFNIRKSLRPRASITPRASLIPVP